jgi:hypothetical protein
MNVKDCVISARIPLSLKNQLDNLLLSSGMNTSQFIQISVANEMSTAVIKSGAVEKAVNTAHVSSKKDSAELSALILAMAGGSAMGLVAYKLTLHLIQKYFPEYEKSKEDIAGVVGLSAAVATAMYIQKKVK